MTTVLFQEGCFSNFSSIKIDEGISKDPVDQTCRWREDNYPQKNWCFIDPENFHEAKNVMRHISIYLELHR